MSRRIPFLIFAMLAADVLDSSPILASVAQMPVTANSGGEAMILSPLARSILGLTVDPSTARRFDVPKLTVSEADAKRLRRSREVDHLIRTIICAGC